MCTYLCSRYLHYYSNNVNSYARALELTTENQYAHISTGHAECPEAHRNIIVVVVVVLIVRTCDLPTCGGGHDRDA